MSMMRLLHTGCQLSLVPFHSFQLSRHRLSKIELFNLYFKESEEDYKFVTLIVGECIPPTTIVPVVPVIVGIGISPLILPVVVLSHVVVVPSIVLVVVTVPSVSCEFKY